VTVFDVPVNVGADAVADVMPVTIVEGTAPGLKLSVRALFSTVAENVGAVTVSIAGVTVMAGADTVPSGW
jgi:hypothetical protein